MSTLANETFPKPVLIGVSALLAFTVIAAAAARFERLQGPTLIEQAGPAAESVDLRFADEPNGAVEVRNSHDQLIKTIKPGEDAFIRVVVRGLAHERLRRKIGPQQPFHLAVGRNGKLTLQDPATGRLIDLEGFGKPERQYFADLLPTQRSGS
jgi:putative photosynthetic complex assembly protein